MSEARPADIWLGPGFWKFAWVTNDRARAIEHFQSKLGIEDEERLQTTLRPRDLAEFIGQDLQRRRLSIALEAARQRQAVARPSRPVCGWCCLLILASQEVAVIEVKDLEANRGR